MLLDLHVTITVSTISYNHPILTLTNLVFSHQLAIQAWNSLPISIIESDSMQLFIAKINQFYSCTC